MERSLGGGKRRRAPLPDATSVEILATQQIRLTAALATIQWLGLDGLLMRRSGWARKIETDAKPRVPDWAPIFECSNVRLFGVELTFQSHIARDVVHEFLSQKLPLALTLDKIV